MTNSLSALSLDQLKQGVALREQNAALENELAGILGGEVSTPPIPVPVQRRRGPPPGKLRTVVPAAPSTAPVPVRTGRGGARDMSPEARARIIAAQKARWAKYRKEKGIKG